MREIDQTYELLKDLDAWNLRGRYLLNELLAQISLYSCAGGVWTQTTDVEGEVNGLMTYDRRILRADVKRWRKSLQVSDGICAPQGIVQCILTSIRPCMMPRLIVLRASKSMSETSQSSLRWRRPRHK